MAGRPRCRAKCCMHSVPRIFLRVFLRALKMISPARLCGTLPERAEHPYIWGTLGAHSLESSGPGKSLIPLVL